MYDAKEYKQRLGIRAKDIIARGLGLDKYKKDEACCPFHKEKTPSFKWHDEGLMWKCFGCGEKLDIYRYYTDFRGMTFQEAVKEVAEQTGGLVELSYVRQTTYKKPEIKTDKLSKEAIEYMAKRKISLQTLNDWMVVEREWNGKKCFVFQYFDDKNDLQYVSYREVIKGGLKGGCEKDTKPILWGMWHIEKDKPVVITEGQPDALAIWESGYKNVVSVPSGSNNLTWIDTCWDWLQDIQEFIVFGDNDEPGMKMVEELLVRLGKYKVKVVDHKYKDANELLYREGKEAVINAIDKTIKQSVRGIIKMSNVEYEPYNFQNGIPTGIIQLDKTLEDLKPQELSILVGRSGEGKSTIISQMICNSIENQLPVFLYSGELSTRRVINWIYKQAIGKETKYLEPFKTKYNTIYIPTKQAYNALQKWSGDYFYTFDKTKDNVRKNQDDLFNIMELAVKRHGCKWLIIDNLMSAMEESADSINSDQSNFTQRCKDFAESFNVHVTLVVHPNKLKKKGEKIEKEDISGSNNIPNKADVILSIERQFQETKDCDSLLRLIKDREEGNYIEVKLIYDNQSKRLLELENMIAIEKEYSWKKYYEKDWADKLEEIAPWDRL